jgi:hypothetical protein
MAMISQHGGFGLPLCLAVLSAIPGRSQTVGATVPVRGSPQAVAVNTVTSKIYVANYLSGSITQGGCDWHFGLNPAHQASDSHIPVNESGFIRVSSDDLGGA